MDKNTLDNLLLNLSRHRPIFHSEADFQFSLATLIQKTFPTAEIRLERPFSIKFNKYLDILVKLDGKAYPIELKYKTTSLRPNSYIIQEEIYQLKYQGAKDLGSFYFLKDLERLEELSIAPDFEVGFTIFLTNDLSYQRSAKFKESNYADFALEEASIKTGEIKWRFGKMLGQSVNLKNSYKIHWQAYSHLEDDHSGQKIQNGDFNYILLSIPKPR